ncbi:dicarboxylate/amino acid:cation symporter [Jeotgalibacillus marinus]|uniref:Dicarboxylate/amino acid:cation symporter n=1 Tax=Jeotgalibacillus marinus TaxID=86667 RepID=A0ABV3Q5P0_9BACL
MKLIGKLVLGIIAGILIGLLNIDPVTQLFVTIKGLFGQFIGFVIPFLILFFIVSGISKLGDKSGKMVGVTVGTAYLSSLLAGLFAFAMAITFIPLLSNEGTSVAGGQEGIEPFFHFEIDPVMGVLTALVAAFLFGIGIAKTKSLTLMRFSDEGKNIIDMVLSKVIVPFLPIYIASIFVELAAKGEVFNILKVFGMVLLIGVVSQSLWLIIQFSVAGALTKQNPFVLLKSMLPAYFTAIGTMSSAATIPVTLEQVKKNNVKEEVADFVVPLCATIHLSGSVITIVVNTIAIMNFLPDFALPTFGNMLPFIAMLSVIMVAAPGVPGGAVMAAVGILTSMLGFTELAVGLIIALHMTQDGFGTAANITGDGAISTIVNKFSEGDSGVKGNEIPVATNDREAV